MPGMDGTGPFGNGAFGRGMGPCGNGLAGWGRGRGFRRWNNADLGGMPTPLSAEEEKAILEQRKVLLETQLEAIKAKLGG